MPRGWPRVGPAACPDSTGEFLTSLTMTNPSESALHFGPADAIAWRGIIEKYRQSSTPRAIWQIVNTLGPYALLWYLMYRSLAVSWWLTLPLAILAGAFLVRVFIIFHD